MAIYVNNNAVEMVYRNSTALKKVYANNNMVWEAIKYVAKPTVTANLTYNGSTQRPTISPSSSPGWTIVAGSVTSAVNGGTYTITFKLNAGYAWSDETTANVSRTWTIKRQSVAIPQITTKNVAYIGSTVSPTVSGYNSSLMTASGNTSYNGIASNLAIKWNLKNTTNYQWSDGTTSQKSDTWSTYAGTITWYLHGSSGNFVFQTTYGKTFNELAGTWSSVIGSLHAKIIQGATYATYDMYDGDERLYSNAFRNSGGTQYSKTDKPAHGATYY